MKINWGTGIVLAFVAFITFILYFIVLMNTDSRANVNLVTEDYYRAELGFQKQIEAEKRANELTGNITIRKTAQGLDIVFPKNMENQNIKGTISLYRPSNKKIDFKLPLELSGTQMLVPKEKLLGGRWDVTILWTFKGEDYMYRKRILY